MKTADVVVIGAGVIGLSLACNLRRAGFSVLVLEKHQPGHEATWAAGGMIAHCEIGPDISLQQMAKLSAALYPSFVREIQDESGVDVDYRSEGKIRFVEENIEAWTPKGTILDNQEVRRLEPEIAFNAPAVLLQESWLDPRKLVEGLVKAAKHLGVELISGAEVKEIAIEQGRTVGAITPKATYGGVAVVNCAGAWSGQFSPVPIPARPIKGQMLCLVPDRRVLRHVISGNGVYLIPRTDGRIVVGATVEDVGFDKRVDPSAIQALHQRAANLVPALGEARIHDSWAGLRPGTPDELPMLGRTELEGYFVATGHYRDGILLAPATASAMTQILAGHEPGIDISRFSPSRFTLRP
ncbi:MAG TPA: glycine oxidase ThiO [Terriglobales bacterium]|nr:glycine oxidase ThiO [Terriglobales bacterium]